MILKDNIRYFKSITSAKFQKKRIPLFVALLVTHRCNHRCKYCFRWCETGQDMSKKEIFKLIAELKIAGTRFISLTGGEPLMRSDIGEIIDYAVDKNIQVRLNSNGSLVRKRLKEIKNINVLTLSLDGPEQIHDSLRGEI